jgi:drug/metabolite transporter (DMT)-like permease
MGSRDDMRVPDPLLPPTLAVVALGMLSSLGWGVADFGGGLASRTAPVLGVLLGSQLASLAIGIPILALATEPPFRPQDLAISALGGLLAASGLALLYRGLSLGRMGVVAPVAAVLTATMPVGFGFLTEGLPSALAIVGIAAAVTSVVLVSRSADSASGRPSGLRYGLAAGVIFGTFTVFVSALPDELILSPTIAIRVASVATLVVVVVVGRQPWRVGRRLWPALVAIGVIDMFATVSYLSAIAVGPLSIAAILASLYPVVTTILAAVVLRERVTLVHAAGILAAGVAVALIAGASAA